MSCIALTISGWDPSAGAGAAADLKTFAAWGLYGQAALTALTVQNTQGVFGVEAVRPEHLANVLGALQKDAAFSAIKIGMLANADIAEVVAAFLSGQAGVPVVVDPVVRSSSGAELLSAEGVRVLIERILPLATWLTPNAEELAALTGAATTTNAEIETAAASLAQLAPGAKILVTGGDRDSPDDYLLLPGESAGRWIAGERVETTSTHGTGCTLASSLAAREALRPADTPDQKVIAAKRYVEGALRHAPAIGRGHGPLEHFWQHSTSIRR